MKSTDAIVASIAAVCHGVNRAYCLSQGDRSQPTWNEAPLAEKQQDGLVYGEVKDPAAKTHPCFVPYDELPPSQKAKDYIFLAIVRELAPILERAL